jgi:hypothetical protein
MRDNLLLAICGLSIIALSAVAAPARAQSDDSTDDARQRPPAIARIGAELGVGTGLMIGGAGLVGLGTSGISRMTGLESLPAGILGTLAGGIAGLALYPTGVWLGGRWAGGNGGIGWTYLGSFGGWLVVGTAVGFLLDDVVDNGFALAAAIFAPFLVGGILAYELSDRRPDASRSSSGIIAPVGLQLRF